MPHFFATWTPGWTLYHIVLLLGAIVCALVSLTSGVIVLGIAWHQQQKLHCELRRYILFVGRIQEILMAKDTTDDSGVEQVAQVRALLVQLQEKDKLVAEGVGRVAETLAVEAVQAQGVLQEMNRLEAALRKTAQRLGAQGELNQIIEGMTALCAEQDARVSQLKAIELSAQDIVPPPVIETSPQAKDPASPGYFPDDATLGENTTGPVGEAQPDTPAVGLESESTKDIGSEQTGGSDASVGDAGSTPSLSDTNDPVLPRDVIGADSPQTGEAGDAPTSDGDIDQDPLVGE